MTAPRLLVGFTGPSGSGKTTLAKLLQTYLDDMEIRFHPVVSVTTRAPRAGEEHGSAYYFVAPEDFDAQGEYVETLEFHGKRYGMTFQELNRIWQLGSVPVVMLDPQGLEQTVAYCRTNDILFLPVFVDAPRDKLIARYLQRVYAEGEAGQESDLMYHGARVSSIYEEATTWRSRFLATVGSGEFDPRILLDDVEANAQVIIPRLASTIRAVVVGLQKGVKQPPRSVWDLALKSNEVLVSEYQPCTLGSDSPPQISDEMRRALIAYGDARESKDPTAISKAFTAALYALPARSLESLQAEIVQWAHATFGHKRNLRTISRKLREEMKELQDAFEAMNFTQIGDESADVQILLWDAMFLLGLDPVAEIQKKLALNRERSWAIDNHGVSRHV